jgi:Bcr/CflA subfamily drug resistance transporter
MMNKKSKIIAILCLTVTVGRFALDSYLPSLPFITRYFASTHTEAEMTLTLYLLGFGLSQFIYGPLSDFYGRRNVMILGFCIFTVSSFMCLLSPSIHFLIFSRFLSGIGAGASSTLSRAIISDIYTGVDLAKAWSKVTTSLMVSLIIAPVCGGYIQISFGWRYNFLISTLYALVVLFIIAYWLPETKSKENPSNFKFSIILKKYYFLLKQLKFIAYIGCSALTFSGLTIYFQLSPFLLIDQLGLSARDYGWASLVIAFSYVFSGIILNKYMNDVITMHKMMLSGFFLLVLGGCTMYIFTWFQPLSVYSVLLPSLLYVVGARIVIPSATAGSLSFSKKFSGIVAAITGGLQMLISSVISCLVAHSNLEFIQLLLMTFTINGICALLIFYFFIFSR